MSSFLIGSQASKHLGLKTRPSDWDFLISWKRLVSWLSENLYHVKYYQTILQKDTYTAPPKIRAHLMSGTTIEFEILDYAPSFKYLVRQFSDKLPVPTSFEIDDTVTIDSVIVPPPELLYLIKLSHLHLPVNWRKTVRQLIELNTHFFPNIRSYDIPKHSKVMTETQLIGFMKKRKLESQYYFREIQEATGSRSLVPPFSGIIKVLST